MEQSSAIALHTLNPADRVALRGVRLRSRLTGMSQRTTIEQTFVNLEDRAIEAIYTFPLPESAAVCGFEVVTGDRVLTGKVEEAERAIDRYEEAINEGHGAFLMEQDRPDVFTVRVGNLKPRQAATIRLTYVCALEKADKSIRVAFPTTVAPRFVAATGDPLQAMLDGDALNPPHVLAVPYGLTLEVEVDLGRELKNIVSPSHSIHSRATEAGTTLVSLAAGVADMDRDVVLEVRLAGEHRPCVQAANGPDGATYLAVTFLPEFTDVDLADPPPVETVFVLDCSGSMQGDSIRQATAALELCLRSLSPGDTFNVCRFGSTWDLMASEPLPYTQATLDRALTYVREAPDLGGTVLHPALEVITSGKPSVGAVRQVILLTDGQVSNEPEVIELARKYRQHNRIFSFGIGSACSAFLVKGVARATGGAAEFITEGERIDDKVLRTFSRLASPMVDDVSIDWDGAEVQTLAELPPVFDGDILAVFGRAAGRVPKTVTLSCTTAIGLKSWSLVVSPPLDDGGTIATMWARRMIQSLEEVNGIQTLRLQNPKPAREQQTLIGLSEQFGLLCSLTTFVAVEHRSIEERNEGRPELRRVPVKLAKGWGDMDLCLSAPPAAAGGGQVFACALHSAGTGLMDLGDPADDMAGDWAQVADAEMLRAIAPAGSSPAQSPPVVPPSPASGSAVSRKRGMLGSVKRMMTRASVKSSPPAGPADDPSTALPPSERPSPERPSDDPLKRLLSRQTAEGWFDDSDAAASELAEFTRGCGHDSSIWEQRARSTLPPLANSSDGDRVVRTALVLVALAVCFADQQPMWLRARAKAYRVLAKALQRSTADAAAWVQGLASAP